MEAEQEGWLGEIDGLQVGLTGAEGKSAQLDAEEARRSMTVNLGMPAFPDRDQEMMLSAESTGSAQAAKPKIGRWVRLPPLSS
ncbi:hypothetical protein ACWCQK_39735 [Streptomyces sp. NPDC002306]